MINEFKELYKSYKSVEAKQLVDYMSCLVMQYYWKGIKGEEIDIDDIKQMIKCCADDTEYLENKAKMIEEENTVLRRSLLIQERFSTCNNLLQVEAIKENEE